ncbi:MAG: hypothetical protein ACFFAU_01580 [Candidatus Hodarchaeota archaeon]
MSKQIYIKNCCYFCTEREVNCKGCVIAKDGIEAIKKNCQKWIEAGVCKETFGDKINKMMCFTPSDEDTEKLEGKSTSKLVVGNKEEPAPKKEEKKKELTAEERTTQLADALRNSAAKGDIDINALLNKLGVKKE